MKNENIFSIFVPVYEIKHAVKVGNFLNSNNMQTKNLETPQLPRFLPHGWKTEVAKTLGVHPMTIKRNIRKGSGPMFERIVKTAAAKYGKKKEIES